MRQERKAAESTGNIVSAASAGGPLVGAVLALAVIGWFDFATGIDLRVFPLYFLPLTFVALRFDRRLALGFSLLCGVTWFASNHLAGMGRLSPRVMAANTVIMLVGFTFVTMLASRHRASYERERVLSRTDALTGLPNSRGFHEGAAVEIARAARYRRPLTVAYLDIDWFKNVNDRLGHASGDELLVTVARSLRRFSRASDLVGRLGGDEFAILCPETDRSAAEAMLTKLRTQVREALRHTEWPELTFSIGAVSFREPPGDLAAVLRQADAVMYAVKVSGKDAVRTADGDVPAR